MTLIIIIVRWSATKALGNVSKERLAEVTIKGAQ
jgi:hypothetical protein